MNSKTVDERMYSFKMRGKLNNFTIISVPVSTERKHVLVKDSFYGKLNHTYQRIPAHDTKIIVCEFNAKIGREEIFKTAVGNWSLHETSDENGIGATDFASNNNTKIKSKLHISHTKTNIRRSENRLMEELIITLAMYW
jgi:hypothetical protein